MNIVTVTVILLFCGTKARSFPVEDSNFDPAENQDPKTLETMPPAAVEKAAPHIYYMNSDGVAEPAENSRKALLIRKRDVATSGESPKGSDIEPPQEDEVMQTDETFFKSPCGIAFRPARRAYYARRYHKYPWNYH